MKSEQLNSKMRNGYTSIIMSHFLLRISLGPRGNGGTIKVYRSFLPQIIDILPFTILDR